MSNSPVHAGGPGAPGVLILYPPDWNGGKVEMTTEDHTGGATVSVVFAAQAAARTYTWPDAGGDGYIPLSTAALTRAELDVLDGVTAGTVTASKAVVVDANKDIGDFRNVDVTNLDAGASGTAGSVDVFPATASKGKLTWSATDNTNDDATTFTNAAMGQASTITFPDLGATWSVVGTAGAQTIAGAKTFSSNIIPTGGIAAAGGFSATPRLCHTGGQTVSQSTDGTEVTITNTVLYVAEVFIPANCTVTGAAVFWGATTDGNAKIALYNSAGTRVAISASTDVSGFTGDSYGTRIAFSAPYAAVGPATYYLGVICDTGTNTINTHILGNFGAGEVTSLVYATEAGYATITPPTTFTTAKGPIATLY